MPSDLRVLLGTSPLAPNGEAYETYKLQTDLSYAKAVYAYVADTIPLRVQIPAETPISAKITQAPTDPALRVTFDQALYSVATPTRDGLLSSSDKIKLDALSPSAFNGTVGATTRSTGAFTTLSSTGEVSFPGRRRGFVVADNAPAGNVSAFTIDAVGFPGFGEGTRGSMSSFYFMTVLSSCFNHQVQGVALYTTSWNGTPILLQTLGVNAYGGTLSFGVSGLSPRATVTNATGNPAFYDCQIVYLN